VNANANICCVGAGVVGRSWAVAFAAGGRRVRVYDVHAPTLEQAQHFVRSALSDLHRIGLCDEPQRAFQRVSFHTDLAEAVSGAEYVQESIAEDAALKAELFARLDALCGAEAVLASSTSTIPASEFTHELTGAHRCLVAHPINPPHLIPVVELCPSPATSEATVAKARAILEAAKREPIVVTRELPGFVINRLQLALIGEALHLVGEGYCSATDLDRALRYSLGLRWALFGPFEAGHLNADTGYADYMQKFQGPMKALIGDLKVDYGWDEALLETINAELSKRTPADSIPAGQRDRDQLLMALIRFLRETRDRDTDESRKAV